MSEASKVSSTLGMTRRALLERSLWTATLAVGSGLSARVALAAQATSSGPIVWTQTGRVRGLAISDILAATQTM